MVPEPAGTELELVALVRPNGEDASAEQGEVAMRLVIRTVPGRRER
jgi:hypothetical protein